MAERVISTGRDIAQPPRPWMGGQAAVNSSDRHDLGDRLGIADYRFVRLLGAGTSGAFYLAVPPGRLPVDAQYVAVKVVSRPYGLDTFRRAAHELAAFANVKSPNLVLLYDAGQQADDLFFSMEYLPAGSLAAPAEPLTAHSALAAVADAARGAHALHDAGMAHNDIKPGNVLICDGGGRLSDIGLSQVLTPGLTVTGLGRAGSVEFFDPAVIKGELPSRATDVFALGATLHRALTGVGLYGELPADDPILTMRTVLSRTPVIADSLPGDIRDLIASAIDVNPAARPQTAAEFAERIDVVAAQVG
jgi:serine/threonine protein kinase